MSYLLAIESSTRDLSLALFDNRHLLEEMDATSDPRTHSEKLLPLIDLLLSRHKLEPADLSAIVVSQGPGSYTSLRVGLATVAGMAAAMPIKVFGFSSLMATACHAEGENILVAPVLRSGRGKIYGAVYRRDKKKLPMATVVKEAVFDPAQFASKLGSLKEDIYLVGTGCDLVPLFDNQVSRTVVSPKAVMGACLHFSGQSSPLDPSRLKINYLLEPDFG